MKIKTIVAFLGLACGIGLVFWTGTGLSQKADAPVKSKLAGSIKPQHVADALQASIFSHREVYEHALATAKAGETNVKLPAPCELLLQGSQAVASKGVEYAYVLRSLQPINKRNSPETALEIKGLEQVSKTPDKPFAAEELLGGRWYWTAIYPDVAVRQSCVDCHNRHSSVNQYKKGDVLGALVVRIALEL